MKFFVVRDLPGRIRLKSFDEFSDEFAFGLEKYLCSFKSIVSASVNKLSGSMTITYDEDNKESILNILQALKDNPIKPIVDEEKKMQLELRREVEGKILTLFLKKIFASMLPMPFYRFWTFSKSMPFFKSASRSLFKGRMDVNLLDGTAIAISMLQGNISTASNTITLLKLADILEDWTIKRTNIELTKSLELNINKVLVRKEEKNVWIPIEMLQIDDEVVVNQGSIIPADSRVIEGLGTVDESRMTGESELVVKKPGTILFAGTVLSEGSLIAKVEEKSENSRISQIIKSINDAQEGKAQLEKSSQSLADNIVPYSFLAGGLVYLLTGNIIRASAVLMVDYSCAIKLATPIAVISAIRDAAERQVLVKGGRYLEEVANAEVFVFDKTGTLTTSTPKVVDVVAFSPYTNDELLRMAACIEEHFPHPLGKAIVKRAKELDLHHEEEHSEVNYIIAHGISTYYGGKEVIIGSHHFVFDDKGSTITPEQESLIDNYNEKYSMVYLAEDGKAIGFICLKDPLRDNAKISLEKLREKGVKEIYMLTGDSQKAAEGIADELNLDGYEYQVLPDEKSEFLQNLKSAGKKVAMVGDGINDSPALALADVSISMKDSSELAKDVSDIVIQQSDLEVIAKLIDLGNKMEDRVQKNYQRIIAINTALILLGVTGLFSPTLTALIHNSSTLAIGVSAGRKYN